MEPDWVNIKPHFHMLISGKTWEIWNCGSDAGPLWESAVLNSLRRDWSQMMQTQIVLRKSQLRLLVSFCSCRNVDCFCVWECSTEPGQKGEQLHSLGLCILQVVCLYVTVWVGGRQWGKAGSGLQHYPSPLKATEEPHMQGNSSLTVSDPPCPRRS